MTKLLHGRIVKTCRRHGAEEVVIEFECGTTLFVDAEGDVEVSITAGREVGGRKMAMKNAKGNRGSKNSKGRTTKVSKAI
jgi:hypothetical protein